MNLPKPPLISLQSLDARNGVIGSADDPLVVLDHEIHDLVAGNIGHGIAQRASEVLRDHAGAALADVLEGLLPAVGQVHAHDDAPVFAMHGLAVLGGSLLGNVP